MALFLAFTPVYRTVISEESDNSQLRTGTHRYSIYFVQWLKILTKDNEIYILLDNEIYILFLDLSDIDFFTSALSMYSNYIWISCL